ncbi:MAG: polysaccharide biosynthesis/export family protein [Brevundimonas sp.]
MRTFLAVTTIAALLLAGCGGPKMDLSQMTAAREVVLPAAVQPGSNQTEYRIGVGDKLSVRVFQVADLSFSALVVDTSGNISLPLIGAVQANGLTAGELSGEIGRLLAARYLQDPQVTVTVDQAASQKITVDGAVTKPGVYEMRGATTLLQAVAMAEGPSRVADLGKVAVFRTINGERAVALFDLEAIRQGRADDPAVLGNDVIVVDTSTMSVAMREVVGAIPVLSIFRFF